MKEKQPKYYLKNISRRWQAELKSINGKVIILSPYLTSNTAESILRKSKFTECEVYTVFSVHNFVSGASSLKTLKNLYQRGCKLYHLSKLHAKMVVAPGKFATIGSQNITRNGAKSREASVFISNKIEVKKIEKYLEKWIQKRQPITLNMINDLEEKLSSLRRKFSLINRELKKEISDLNDELWEKEAERIEQEELKRKEETRKKREQEELKRKEEARKIKEAELKQQKTQQEKSVIDAARIRVEQLSSHGAIDRELAKKFIAQSTYWDHPKARDFVSAPGHEDRIYGSPNNWRIDFGANTFLVGQAITRCQKTIIDFLEQAEAGYVMPLAELREKLSRNVRGAVAGYEGYEYDGYYPADNNFMRFGTQAININDFINLILRQANLKDILNNKKSSKS